MTRRALCIGINAYPPPWGLDGCVPDARGVAAWAGLRGFHVTALEDRAASAVGIVGALARFADECQRDTTAALVYRSMHGSQDVAAGPDEADGLDELWIGADMIGVRDNEVRDILERIPVTVPLTVIHDACHSSGSSRFANLPGSLARVRSRYVPGAVLRDVRPRVTARAASSLETAADTPWIELAACESQQVAYERDGQGDYTRALLGVLRSTGPRVTLGGVHRRAVEAMGPQRAQNPTIRAPGTLARSTFTRRAGA